MDDLTTLLDPALRLPIGGRTYTVQPPTAAVGLRLEALLAVTLSIQTGNHLPQRFKDALQGPDGEQVDLAKDALGPVYDQMVADGLSLPFIRHAGQTAYRHWVAGPAAGASYWAAGADQGKAPAPQGPTTSTSTAAATTTKRRSSSSGTRSPSRSSAA